MHEIKKKSKKTRVFADMDGTLAKCMIGVLVLLFVGSGGILVKKAHDDYNGEQAYEALRKESLISDNVMGNLEEAEIDLPDVNEKYLLEMNPSYAAWLYLPDTPINYPVVFPDNNQQYLGITFEGEKGKYGSLFFDAETEPMTSLNTVIHGHNMRSGAMFGKLKEYLSGSFQQEHNSLYLNMNGEWEKYYLFSIYCVTNTDAFPYKTAFFSKTDYKKFLKESQKRSIYTAILEADEVENLLTLSTCHGKKEKLIVQWAKPKER